jgi:hypothetical protein
MIRRIAASAFVLGICSTPALAEPAANAPHAGDVLELAPASWTTTMGKTQWTMGTPSTTDAAGKVVIHWFCSPKVTECNEDLTRLVALRDTGNVYIVAYINGSQRDAKKLDPIRESEGVGRGTVASGPGVKKLFKSLGLAKGPLSIVVDVDGKVKAVTTSGDLNELDSRDQVIKGLVDAIKPYTTTNACPTTGNPSSKLAFTIKVQLSPWLDYSKKTPMSFTFTGPKEVQCPTTTLTGDQMKIDGKTLTGTVTCTAPKGVYQARGEIRFGYVSPSGAQGLGVEDASWKFEIKP